MNKPLYKKTIALLFAVLMTFSVSLTVMDVSAQNENISHGGQGTGYMGPSTIPTGVTANLTVETNPYLSISPNSTGVNQYI